MPGGRAAFLPATEARRPCVFKSKARKWWDAILATPSDEEPVSGMVDQEEPRRLTEQLNRVSFLRVLLRLTAANRIRLTNYTADHGARLLGLLSIRPCGGGEFSDSVNWKVAQPWQD